MKKAFCFLLAAAATVADAQTQEDAFRACRNNDVAGLNATLSAGIDIESTESGNTLAGTAVWSSSDDVLKFLIVKGANINVNDREGVNLLTAAAMRDETAIAQILHQHGADCNAKNPDGMNALHVACQRHFKHTVTMLLENGCDPMSETSPSPVDGKVDTCLSLVGDDPVLQEALAPFVTDEIA